MAKDKKSEKKPEKPAGRTVADLTDDEVKKLGTDLARWQGNVYEVLRHRFNIPEPDESIFDRLKGVGDAFKCELCSQWYEMAEYDGDPKRATTDVCTGCRDDMDGKADDED